jgi:hypothetical protein
MKSYQLYKNFYKVLFYSIGLLLLLLLLFLLFLLLLLFLLFLLFLYYNDSKIIIFYIE